MKKKVKRPAAEVTIDASRYVPAFLAIINSTLSWGASRLYRKVYDLGLNEWRVIAALAHEPGIMAARIAEMVALNKSVVSRSLKTLEKSGYVESAVEEGQRLIYLTPPGLKMHDRIIVTALEREKYLMTGFSAPEREQFLSYLGRAKANLAEVAKFDRELMRRKK